MATIHINADTGDDTTGDGSESNPYETFNKANSVVSSSDTINVQDAIAVYTFSTETLACTTVTGETKGLRTVRGNDGIPGSVFDGTAATSQSWTCNISTGVYSFSNFVMQNIDPTNATENHRIFSLDPSITSANFSLIQFTSCKISTSASNAFAGLIAISNVNSTITVTIERCVFDDIVTNGSSVTNLTGFLSLRNPTSSFIVNFNNNVIFQDSNTNVVTNLIYSFQSAGHTINAKNNIFRNTTATSVTIFANNGGTTPTLDHDYGCIDGSYTIGLSGTNTNGITDDPLFIDEDNGNFDLRPSSPCIDAGTLI